MSFFDVLKNFFKKLFNKDKIKKISEMNVHHDKEERKVLNSNDHEKYVESLRNEYFESSKNYKKDYKNLKKCLGITITVGLLFSFLFFLMGLFIPEKIIGIFTSDPKVLKLGANYFRIIALIYPLIGLGYSFNMQLRAIGKNQYSLYSTIIGLCINLVGNYLFINGNLGFPAMGVVGAAIATVIARIVSVFYLIYIIYKNKLPMAGNFQELFKLSWSFIAKALKISLPVFGHEIMWVTGVSMYVIIYGRIGTEATAAIQVVKSISNLVFTLVFGLSSGTAAIIGQEIGAGNEENAYKYAVELLKISLVIGTAVALFVYAICPVVLILMKVDSAIYPLARQIVFSEGILIIIKTTGTLFIVGVLRAGGDTLWTMFADLIPLWTFAIPLTYIAGLKFGLPVALVYLCSGSDELLKMPFCIQRLKSRKWINNLVKTS